MHRRKKMRESLSTENAFEYSKDDNSDELDVFNVFDKFNKRKRLKLLAKDEPDFKLKEVGIKKSCRKISKEDLNRKIKVRKLLNKNKKALEFYKLVNILHKLSDHAEEDLTLNKQLLNKISCILNIEINELAIKRLEEFINIPVFLKIEKDKIKLNQQKQSKEVFSKEIDEFFIDKLSEKYTKTLKFIERQIKIEQEVFERRLEKKNKNVKKIPEIELVKSTKDDKGKSSIKDTVETRMSNILERLKNKKKENILKNSQRSILTDLKYIFEIENKKRLSLKFINEKLKMQNKFNDELTRKSAEILFDNAAEKENSCNNALNEKKFGFKLIELYGDFFVEYIKRNIY